MPSLLATRGALGALLLTTALAVAACGGSGGSASTTTTTAGTTSTTTTSAAGASTAALAKYTACLKQNGVTLPTGGGAPPGAGGGAPPTGTTGGGTSTSKRPAFAAGGNAKFAKAQAACAKLRPAGLRAGGFGGPGGGTNSAAFAAYRNCLTLHGVQASALQRGTKPTAAVTKAMTACASLRPKPAGGAPAATTSGNS